MTDAVLIDKLLKSLVDDADPEHRLLLAEALIGLAPDEASWRTAAAIIAPAALTAAESPSLDPRRADVLARLPLRSIRRHLQQIAADRLHPNARVLAVALASVRDPAGLPTCLHALATDPGESVAQAVAMLPLEELVPELLRDLVQTLHRVLVAKGDAAEAARPWAAIALARTGDVEPLEQLWDALVRPPTYWDSHRREVAFRAPPAMFLAADPALPARELARVRPLPERMLRFVVGLRENDYDADWAPRQGELSHNTRAATIFFAGLTGLCHPDGEPLTAPDPGQRGSAQAAVVQLRQLADDAGQPVDEVLRVLSGRDLVHATDPMAVQVVEIAGLQLDPQRARGKGRRRPPWVYSNAFVNLVAALPSGVPWRATRLLVGPMTEWLPHRALAWTMARAGADHVLSELVPQIARAQGGERTRWLGWLAGIGTQFGAAVPLEGAGSEAVPLLPAQPILIDDTAKRSRPPVHRGMREAMFEAAGPVAAGSEPQAVDAMLGGHDRPQTQAGTREVFPDIEADDAHPVAGATVNFEVRLGSKRSATTSGGARLPDTPPDQVLTLKVHLLLGSESAWDTLEWSAADDTRKPARFTLAVPAVDGNRALMPVRANFYLDRRWCGEGRRLLDVRAAVATPPLATIPPADEPPWRKALELQADARPPDLLVRIQKGTSDGDFVWSCLSPHMDFPAPAQPADACMSLKEDAATFVRKTFAPLAGQLLSDLKLADMEGAGEKIYRNTPNHFKACYWALRHKAEADGFDFESVQIVTDEPCVPWELMRMVDKRRAPGVAAELLSIRHCVGRWLADESAALRQRIQVRQVAVAASSYDTVAAVGGKLPWAAKEKQLMTGTYHAQDVPLNSADLRNFLEHGQAQALHVACHGKMSITDPDASVLLMEDTPADLTPLTVGRSEVCDGLGSQHPLVFLNACEVGAAAGSMSLVAGFPAAFLYAGASALISPLWVVNDERAHRIAEAFYREVFVRGGGRTLGDVLREVRRSWKAEKHLTFLAYVLYGDPMATVDYQ